MMEATGPEEAARRYRAIVTTTFRQLRGLQGTRLRIVAEPSDADEAIRFWLLVRLAGRWQRHGDAYQVEGWEIDFGGTQDGFSVIAEGDVTCPFLGARWAHAAMLGLERGLHRVTGRSLDGTGDYFKAGPAGAGAELEERNLPALLVIRTDADWIRAFESPLGPALKKAWEEEG